MKETENEELIEEGKEIEKTDNHYGINKHIQKVKKKKKRGRKNGNRVKAKGNKENIEDGLSRINKKKMKREKRILFKKKDKH